MAPCGPARIAGAGDHRSRRPVRGGPGLEGGTGDGDRCCPRCGPAPARPSSASSSPSRAPMTSCAWRAAACCRGTCSAASGRVVAGPAAGSASARSPAITVLLVRDVDGYTALSQAGRAAATSPARSSSRNLTGALIETALDAARGHLFRAVPAAGTAQVPRLLLAFSCWRALSPRWMWPGAGHGISVTGDSPSSWTHHLQPDDDWLVAQLAELADEAGLPTAVTNEVTTPIPTAIGSRTCSSASAMAPRSKRRASCCCRTRSTGSSPAASWRASARDCPMFAVAAPGRRVWRAAPPSARPAGWSSASSAIGFRDSACRRGRPRSHTSTSLHTAAYCAVTSRLPSAR